jgi:ABC-type branched-subunit amino acid transport system substrate-binding protein
MSTEVRTLARLCIVLSLLLFGCDKDADDENEIVIGVLLPFTGSSSATASNFERAVLFAKDQVNAAGGIGGKKLRVVSRDTHSELGRSKSSVDQLVAAGAKVILGPESAEIAEQLWSDATREGVVFVSPLVGSAGDPAIDCNHPWFRLAPSAKALGKSLGDLLERESAQKVAILYASGAYDEALRDAVSARFTELSGAEPLELLLDANARSFAATVKQVAAEKVDAVVLATSPRTAALLINEFDSAGLRNIRWFLSPLLKTELFVQNVAPSFVEGALGVAPGIFNASDQFVSGFTDRFRGDAPLEGAYFYFDAAVLVALALERSAQVDDPMPLSEALIEVAAPPGEEVQWAEVGRGLRGIREGYSVYYSGLTGPMLLESCGERRLGVSTVWTVRSGAIVNEAP